MRIVIIGGVAGGASAGARLRRLLETAEITIYERGPYISFANCGLPYHVGGIIQSRRELIIQTPHSFKKLYNIDVKIKHEVLTINPDHKKITAKDLKTNATFEDTYDYLILAPGAEPVKPPIPGIDLAGIFTLRSVPDMDNIIAALRNNARKAVVVGGGYIGVEMAENLVARGLDVILVEMMDQILTFLDPDMAAFASHELESHGIELALGDAVTGFEKNPDSGIAVILASGRILITDMVILSIGVRPEVNLARDAGLKIGITRGIVVNERMQTSHPAIYAVGDAVEVEHYVTGMKTLIPLAGPANRQGRIAADNIAGIPSTYKGTQGTSILKLFDLSCGSSGANSAQLQNASIPFKTAVVHSGSHAGYYPNALVIHLKLLFSPKDGKILGAQAVGYDGVDKRIDVLATGIRHHATVYDLVDYELAYAPPFGSAKDPVNMVGFVAVNDLQGLSPTTDILHMDEYLQNGAVLLDVRTDAEVSRGRIRGAMHIPVDDLRDRIADLPKERPIITYCKIGFRGYIAQRILMQQGFDCLNLLGGYDSFTTFYRHEERRGVKIFEKIADDTQTHQGS